MAKESQWRTKILTKSQLEQVWDMKKSLAAVENALRFIGEGELFQNTCPVLNPNENDFCFLLPHPAYIRPWKVVGDKWLGCNAGNPKKGLPYTVGVTVINDAETMMPIAFMDAAYLTGMRTAAMAAIGAKYLARPDSETLAVIGCGVQGKTHISSMCELGVFSFKKIKAFDLNPEAAASLKEYAEDKYGVEVEACESVKAAIDGADIICLLTNCRDPLVFEEDLKPGVHLVATCLWDIDYANILGKLDKWVIGNEEADYTNFIADFEQKYGLGMDKVYTNLSEIVCGRVKGRERADERTTMTHLGMGANDIAVAYQAYLLACEAGLGTDICLMS